jgi:hypothetical protein
MYAYNYERFSSKYQLKYNVAKGYVAFRIRMGCNDTTFGRCSIIRNVQNLSG